MSWQRREGRRDLAGRWSRPRLGAAMTVAVLVLGAVACTQDGDRVDTDTSAQTASGSVGPEPQSSPSAADDPVEVSDDQPPAPDEAEEAVEPSSDHGEEPAPPEQPSGPPSDERRLEHVITIRGDISPKSVVSSGTGVFVAQNMMYRHTITVYDAAHELVATIPDTVDLSAFGIDHPGGEVRGAPVEAAFTPDGRYAYVSNYKMYGPGFERGGTDTCSPADGYDDSFIYRLDVERLEIDQVIGVGSVPKYVAVTPDGRYVLVSNWCSYDLSVIDTELGREIERVDVGRYPRGIAVTADSATAYIAVMGSYDIAVLDLDGFGVEWLTGVGNAPRHVVLAPDERSLYVTLNGEGVVARVDLDDGEMQRVRTGDAPRSLDISPDGSALYVVNYHANTVAKVRTADMSVLQTIDVDAQPIGITYDRATDQVWVAHYSGSIQVFEDRALQDG